MKAIKRPLIYFLIWVLWTLICLSLSRNVNGFGVTLMYAIIGMILYVIAYYHIGLSSNRIVKEKEPELYEEIRSRVKENFVLPITVTEHEFSAAMMVILYGKVREYPSIRPQIIEYIASVAAMLIGVLIFFAVTLCISFV